MANSVLEELMRRIDAFTAEAHAVLAPLEGAAASKVSSLEQTRKLLAGLSLKQSGLLRDAITCIDAGVYSAAHVLAWAAYVDLLEERIGSGGLAKVHGLRQSWAKWNTLDDLRENVPEYQLIEVARELGLLTKSEMKSVHGLLAKRNECAHPSAQFQPGLNEVVGFVSEVIRRAEVLSIRHP